MKRFYGSVDMRYLREQAFTVFEEVSDGVYLVVKDRAGQYMEYTSHQSALQELNSKSKTVVINRGRDLTGYANWNFDRQGR